MSQNFSNNERFRQHINTVLEEVKNCQEPFSEATGDRLVEQLSSKLIQCSSSGECYLILFQDILQILTLSVSFNIVNLVSYLRRIMENIEQDELASSVDFEEDSTSSNDHVDSDNEDISEEQLSERPKKRRVQQDEGFFCVVSSGVFTSIKVESRFSYSRFKLFWY